MTTTYKRWADNERLYAADLNNLADQAVPYFANTAGRNGAIASPVTGQLCYQADVALVLVYQGGQWVSATLFRSQGVLQGTLPISATGSDLLNHPAPVSSGTNIWVEGYIGQFLVSGGTALSGSHKWVGDIHKTDSAGSNTTIGTVNIDSGSSSVWRTGSATIGALLGTTSFLIRSTWTKTGTPGNLYVFDYLTYRIVV